MPRKKKVVATATEAALPQIPSDWLDQVVTDPMTPEAVENVMRGFKKAVIEREFLQSYFTIIPTKFVLRLAYILAR